MARQRFGLMEAKDAASRMDALCRFIEFWLGPRYPDYGEPAEALAGVALPMPLRRLYEFAGRWPWWDGDNILKFPVPAFAHQDYLVAVPSLQWQNRKVTFLSENQGGWTCSTLCEGEDPPVWCFGELNEAGEEIEPLKCRSLSRFLVSFVLQELTFGSRYSFWDSNPNQTLQFWKQSAEPVWLNGPYVDGRDHNYFLRDQILIAPHCDGLWFAANDYSAVQALADVCGPFTRIVFMVGMRWRLDIQTDGSASVTYSRSPISERLEARAAAFDFDELRGRLATVVTNRGDYKSNVVVFLCQNGPPAADLSWHVHDRHLIRSLFAQALQAATEANVEIASQFEVEWA